MFIHINPKFSQLKSYLCFSMFQTVNQNHHMYQFFTQITKEIQFKSNHQVYL
jgi:hypothetical protein